MMFKVGDKVRYVGSLKEGHAGAGTIANMDVNVVHIEGHTTPQLNGPWTRSHINTYWMRAHEVEPERFEAEPFDDDGLPEVYGFASTGDYRVYADGVRVSARDEFKYGRVEAYHRARDHSGTAEGWDPDGLPRTEDRPGWTSPAKHDPPPAPMQAGIDWDWVDWCVKDAKGNE
jgi:hypothetical protein